MERHHGRHQVRANKAKGSVKTRRNSAGWNPKLPARNPPAQMTVNLDSVPCLATGPKRGSSGQARHWPQRTMLRLDESRGLRPPHSSAEGLDRACHPAFVCHQAFDAKMRLNSTQMLCQPFSLRQIYADSDNHPRPRRKRSRWQTKCRMEKSGS
jgi:hypothetical protein